MCISREFMFIFILASNQIRLVECQTSIQSACYEKNGKAKTCMTYPKNVAFNRKVTATNTCGTPSELYCQIGADKDKCKICDANNLADSHPPRYMVDLYNPSNITWWQSQSWWQTNKQGTTQLFHPLKVNITVNFNKLYLITGSIRVTFFTVRPKRMIISRSSDYGKTWKEYQYFAKTCMSAYNLAADPVIDSNNRYQATCTQKFSSEIPYAGGSVVFDPRVTRYTVSEYLNIEVQQYLAATDVRFMLEYPGTDGREYINKTDTLSQYYYAVSDIVINGRCDCNGHAEYCDKKNETEICDCKHFTTGQDCQLCLPLYNNRPWMAGNSTSANECEKCICYDHASSCVYDNQIGPGVCQNCQHNTKGVHCETCMEKYFRNISKLLNDVDVCIPCDCFMLGITDNGTCLQVASPLKKLGQCNCKAGVYGRKCDQCVPGKWGFVQPPIGTCFDCACNAFGTVGSNATCNQYTGQCNCKSNIQGLTCSQCKDMFYGFPTNTSADCVSCGCDFAGGYPICNKLNGMCTCKRGIMGKQCSSVANGYYFPNFTHLKYEVEMKPSGNHEFYWLLKGYQSIFLGYGQVKLSEGQALSYSLQVPVTYRYYIMLRYSLYPLSWYNMVFLYNAESINWSGEQSISAYTKLTDNPSNWNISLSVYDSSNVVVKSTTFSIGSLLVGEAGIWTDATVVSLFAASNYKITITYISTGGKFGSTWPLLIDSIILMPDLTQNSYYNIQSAAKQNEIRQCYIYSKQLQTMSSMSPVCRQHTFSVSVLMYNGTLPCDCFVPGAINPSNCEKYGGKCSCKPGYGGRRCDHCLPGFYGDQNVACVACGCSVAGSLTQVCNQTTGNCFCKLNAEGSKCGRCKPGTFALTSSNPDGCGSCFGFGHLTSCKEASNFVRKDIISNFTVNGLAGWSLINIDGSSATSQLKSTANGLQYVDNTGVNRYLSAPSQFFGNQLHSYGQLLTIEMTINPQTETLISRSWQVKLTGGGLIAVFNLFPSPNKSTHLYNVRLHEKFMVNSTKLSEFAFKSLLGQLTGLHIVVNYYVSTTTITVKYIKMQSAYMSASAGLQSVKYIENATCLLGYEGLSCERCIKGYTRLIPNGGPLVSCVPCNCNERSTECDQQTGLCQNCKTGTTGNHCEKCMPNLMSPNCSSCLPGFWKISTSGCQPCNCYLPGTINGNTITCDLVTGQCLCNSSMNVEGKQCNQCKQNAYNVSLGELRCKQCPPCYSLIEQEYIMLHYQMTLLQNEVNILLKDPTLLSITPLHQTVAVTSVLVAKLTSKAQISSLVASSLDALWTAMQRNLTEIQTSLTTKIAVSFNSMFATVTQVMSSYNQSFASLSSISQIVISSHSVLTTSVTNSVINQQAALNQLKVLSNESVVQLTSVRSQLNAANSLKMTASSRISQSIQISSLAAKNSESYLNTVTSTSSSMASLRALVNQAHSLGVEMQQFASSMKINSSAVIVYANQLNADVADSLIVDTQVFSTVNAATTTLSSQVNILNELISAATSNNNGVGQQISVLKQSNAVMNSEVSTTERRLVAVTSRVSSTATKASTASISASDTQKEALSILNTVQNFQTVSRQASVDAADALKKVDGVQTLIATAFNTTTAVNTQLSPIKTTVNQVMTLSTQAYQIAMTEKQEIGTIHLKAKSLQNQSRSSLNTIRGLNVRQYISNTINPLLSRCLNYTDETNQLVQKRQSTSSQATLSLATSQNVATTIVQLSRLVSVIPSINMNQMTTIYDNLLRVRAAYTALNIQKDLAGFRAEIEEMRRKIISYQSKINLLKKLIASYAASFNSLTTLSCTIPSTIP